MGKNLDPGSGINIPNPQHCLTEKITINILEAIVHYKRKNYGKYFGSGSALQ
jgi:hypothetical protein